METDQLLQLAIGLIASWIGYELHELSGKMERALIKLENHDTRIVNLEEQAKRA